MNTSNVNTTITLSDEIVTDYFRKLVSKFFKILPMWESAEKTLPTYMQSLMIELTGCRSVVGKFANDADFLTLISILQYFIDHPDCEKNTVRSEVFHAISLCDAIKARCHGGAR